MPVCVGFHTSSVKLMKLTADTHRKIAEEEKQTFVFQKMRKTKNITAGSATVQQRPLLAAQGHYNSKI